jgi:hypothetical protein
MQKSLRLTAPSEDFIPRRHSLPVIWQAMPPSVEEIFQIRQGFRTGMCSGLNHYLPWKKAELSHLVRQEETRGDNKGKIESVTNSPLSLISTSRWKK